ncbi:hypothetical protein [Dyadobacter subterraneus]|uniref:hypothetical protein n=1 Tax=Dyadobacter subterraneus TaxID=2773304 RepID=UPI0036D2B4C6
MIYVLFTGTRFWQDPCFVYRSDGGKNRLIGGPNAFLANKLLLAARPTAFSPSDG